MSTEPRVAMRFESWTDPFLLRTERLGADRRKNHAAFLAEMQQGLSPRGDLNGKIYTLEQNAPERYWIDEGYYRSFPNSWTYENLFKWVTPEVKEDLFDTVPKGLPVQDGSVLVHARGYPQVYMTDHQQGPQGGPGALRFILDLSIADRYNFSLDHVKEIPVRVLMMCPKGDIFT